MTIARPASNAAPTSTLLTGRWSDVRAQPGRADERGDDDHREGQHDRLVDAEADRPAGKRQLDLAQDLRRVEPSESRGLDGRRRARCGCPSAVIRIAGGIA